LPYFIADKELILEQTKELLYQERMENSVRLLGISLSNLNTGNNLPLEGKSLSVQLKFDF
jgi:DNA polymerase-4